MDLSLTIQIFSDEGNLSDLNELRDLNNLKIAKFELSAICIENLKRWRWERQIH